MNEINEWLNGTKDFNKGVELFERYCKNPNMARIFRKSGQTKRSIESLTYELEKFIRANSKKDIVQIKIQQEPTVKTQEQDLKKKLKHILFVIFKRKKIT